MTKLKCKCGECTSWELVNMTPQNIADILGKPTLSAALVATALRKAGPNYPVPALQLRAKHDYSDLHPGRVIGLMLGDFTNARLVEYWPRETF